MGQATVLNGLTIHDDISRVYFVIPGLRSLPRSWYGRIQSFSGFLLEFIPVKTGAGMTSSITSNVAVHNNWWRNYKRKGFKNKGRIPWKGFALCLILIIPTFHYSILPALWNLVPSCKKRFSIQLVDFGRKVIQNRFEPEIFIDLKKFWDGA